MSHEASAEVLSSDPASDAPRRRTAAIANRLAPEDRAAHDWYRFVLSYPPHMVRDYLARFGAANGARVLDPFSGTGTTVVECRKQGLAGIGLEAHPMAQFAAATKVNWSVDPSRLRAAQERIATAAERQLKRDGVIDQPQQQLPF